MGSIFPRPEHVLEEVLAATPASIVVTGFLQYGTIGGLHDGLSSMHGGLLDDGKWLSDWTEDWVGSSYESKVTALIPEVRRTTERGKRICLGGKTIR